MDKKQIKLLKKIVETPSPTGSEVAVANLIRSQLASVADEITTDTMGSVHATYDGSLHRSDVKLFDDVVALDDDIDGDDSDEELDVDVDVEMDIDETDADEYAHYDDLFTSQPLTLMLAAHMDEIGLMVTYISDDGFLSVSAIGGVDAAILPGMRVDVHTKDGKLRGVVGRKPIHLIELDERKNVTPLDSLVIDLGMSAKKVKKHVRIGDSITFGVGFERFGHKMAVSRAFDDKVGVYIACRVMENLAEDPDYRGTFVSAITVQEEIGTRGAMTSAHSIRPDVALAFDVTHATDYPGIAKTKYGEIKCGGGPVIARGPNINPVVFDRLVKAAEDEGIEYQLEAEPSVTGTDARAIQVTREGIPTGLISIPLRYMHTPTEVINLDDVENTVKLITRFAQDLEDEADFVPGHPLDYHSIEHLEAEQTYADYDYLAEEVERLSEEFADLQVLTEFKLDSLKDSVLMQSDESDYDDEDTDDDWQTQADYNSEFDDDVDDADGIDALNDEIDVEIAEEDVSENQDDYFGVSDYEESNDSIAFSDAPFARQQKVLSDEFKALDLGTKTIEYSGDSDDEAPSESETPYASQSEQSAEGTWSVADRAKEPIEVVGSVAEHAIDSVTAAAQQAMAALSNARPQTVDGATEAFTPQPVDLGNQQIPADAMQQVDLTPNFAAQQGVANQQMGAQHGMPNNVSAQAAAAQQALSAQAAAAQQAVSAQAANAQQNAEELARKIAFKTGSSFYSPSVPIVLENDYGQPYGSSYDEIDEPEGTTYSGDQKSIDFGELEEPSDEYMNGHAFSNSNGSVPIVTVTTTDFDED